MLISHESLISGIQVSQMIHRKSYLPIHLPLLLWPMVTLRGQIDIAAESSQAKQIEGASRGYKWGSCSCLYCSHIQVYMIINSPLEIISVSVYAVIMLYKYFFSQIHCGWCAVLNHHTIIRSYDWLYIYLYVNRLTNVIMVICFAGINCLNLTGSISNHR